MDPLNQRHFQALDGTHGSHSLAERVPQSAQEASAHSSSITPNSVHHRTLCNNNVDGGLEGNAVTNSRPNHTTPAYEEGALFEKDDNTGDRRHILDLDDDSTDCYQRTDFPPRQAPFTTASAISFDTAARPAETISQRQHRQRQEQKQASEWHHVDQMATGRLVNIEPDALQQQQMTILHPALSSLPVPSSAAPTVFTLASSVPNPTVSQLSMNLPNQPGAEQVPLPFKTILCPPSNTEIGPPTGETSPLAESSMQPQHDASQQPLLHERNYSSESTSLDTHATPNSSLDHMMAGGRDDTIHSNVTSPRLAERGVSPQSNQTRREATCCKLGLVSSPSPSTLSTPSTNSKQMPVHDQDLDPRHFRTNADQQQKAEENQVGNNNVTDSSTAVYGISPMDNNRDPKASIQLKEDHVLRDEHIRCTLSLNGQKSAAPPPTVEASAPPPPAVEASAPPPPAVEASASPLPVAAGPESKAISSASGSSGGESGDELLSRPSGADRHLSHSKVSLETPRVRAGISPMLDLDQVEKVLEVPMRDDEESVESLVESMDWSKTGLGPRSGWPRELVVMMQILMKSPSPLALYWGDKDYLLYNDAWRPILKQKHPHAMGAPGVTVWSEIWNVLGSQIEEVRRERRGTDNKCIRLDLHREGYDEECYFDFTFTPVFLEDDSTGGILALVNEVTPSILNQRRLTTLNQFSKQAPLIQSVNGAYSIITTILQESNNPDVPFSIVYRTKEVGKHPNMLHAQGMYTPPPSVVPTAPTPATNGQLPTTPVHKDPLATGTSKGKKDGRRVPQTAILCSTSFDRNLEEVSYGEVKERVFSKATSTRHIPDSLLITPDEYEPLDPSEPVYDDPWSWPVRSVLADGIPRLVTLPKSTHKLARALLLPIFDNPSVLESRITTILIVGINPFRMLDNQYLDFLSLLVANIASLQHFGRSREEERQSTEALFELNKAKISFFQNVSHELRTPLTLMLAPLDDVLNQTPENAPTRPNLEMVRRNSRRLLKLVNTLLQFSRIEAGKGHAVFEETDLSKTTREISANFESVACGFGLKYIIKCEDLKGMPGGVWVDRSMWGGIILNLIGNAFKHTWEGSITVHQYPSKDKNGRDGIAVDVKDTGVGIAPEHLHTLFGRFNRIENKQSRSHEGTGIGLSLVKELTEVHGGVVSVTSEVDKGSCFHIWIPAGRSHLPSAQVKLGDSVDTHLRPPQNEAMNNKTDASMYVEEASQWIAHKAVPGSTLNASGTDSTEEEKPEEEDDILHLGVDYMREQADSLEMNSEYEVSTMDVDENELTKILIDSPASGDVPIPENALAKTITTQARQSSSMSHSPKTPVTEAPNISFKEQAIPSTVAQTNATLNTSVNDNGRYSPQSKKIALVKESEHEKQALPETRSRRGFIIVVDDNHDMRSYLREILGKDFRVRCAVDGLDAIRLITERLQQGRRIDLILSDVAMPNMNGYELLKRLRSDSATMMTPFILLSARAGEEANVEGLDLGADDCLVKPFSARELIARVRSTIRLSDLRHELIREQRHALEMKQLIYSISVRIRSGLSLPQILDTASRELFKVIRCNAIRICRFRSVDQETGQHWVRFVSEIVRVGKPKILAPVDRLLPKGLEAREMSVSNGEHDSSSELRHVSSCFHPMFGAKSFISVALIYNRKIWGYLLASRDVDMVDWSQSEKLLFEQTGNQISLAIAHASLWELKKSQQVEMEAAHAASEAKSQILANTSHELRTPIGAIVGALSALEDTDYNLTGEQRDMVKIMQITSDVALSVINDLLDTAKLEAGAMSLNIKECPGLIETLEQSVRIFADKAGRKEVDLIMEHSEDLESLDAQMQQGSSIWTDGDRLQQVIMNLIGNAVKFTSVGKVMISCSLLKTGTPRITNVGGDFTLSLDDQPQESNNQDTSHPRVQLTLDIPSDAHVSHVTFRFEVSDTGIGIDPDFLKNHIFKSFAQYDQSMTRRFGGTGLGLAISKHLVMMNGGILGVTSNVGQGSTFYFTWPFSIVTPNPATQRLLPPSGYRSIFSKPILAPEIAFETRAVVIEPLAESRQLLARILSLQNIQVTFYESCEGVVQDEQERQSNILGPDGTVLKENYRPNAHYFFATRSNTAEITIETARALGDLFKKRNERAKAEGLEHYKDLVLSVILMVFSSPQGRVLAKDMIQRICGDGLENTVQCRYIVKPVKADRMIECLQMLESNSLFTANPSADVGMREESRNLTEAGALQNALQPQYAVSHGADAETEQEQMHSNATLADGNVIHPSTQVIRADGSVCSVSSDYERENNCNNNTPESSLLDPEGRAESFDTKASQTKTSSDIRTDADTNTTCGNTYYAPKAMGPGTIPNGGAVHAPKLPAAATHRKLRMKPTGADHAVGRILPVVKDAPGSHSKDELAKSSSENPAFSNRAARAAAGKRERKGKCVLCVEDNIINLRVVQYQLQKLGYDTQSACDGQVAVDIIKSQVEMHSQSDSSSAEPENGLIIETGGTDGRIKVAHSTGESDGLFTYYHHHYLHRPQQYPPSSSSMTPSTSSDLRLNGNGLLVIPESNGNASHAFDQTELSSLFILAQPIVIAAATDSSISTSESVPAHLSAATAASTSNSSTTMLPSKPRNGDTAVATQDAKTDSATSGQADQHTILSTSETVLVAPSGSATSTLALAQGSAGDTTTSAAHAPPLASSSASQQHSKIDLILMDCAMPVKSGFDAASEIRAMGLSSLFAANIPIIALTASAVPSTKEKCIASGMNGYLSKPTKLADLEAMLNQWIE
ncbi:hypothetical protein BGZ99_008166 [Dissophora globulifera]|uniref:histidine kinase n=1 Tax=Dissophora globulifera TaxID=979702 RepID=A0A9P6RCF9_9FUNG|nr:hypothetical protein BGZ99_008166 [Dissophora globulifera]